MWTVYYIKYTILYLIYGNGVSFFEGSAQIANFVPYATKAIYYKKVFRVI